MPATSTQLRPSVLRKIDLHVLPMPMRTYMLRYLDKSSINFASVYGLEEGTSSQGQTYSWLSSFLNFVKLVAQASSKRVAQSNAGYLIARYPAGYALQRLPIG